MLSSSSADTAPRSPSSQVRPAAAAAAGVPCCHLCGIKEQPAHLNFKLNTMSVADFQEELGAQTLMDLFEVRLLLLLLVSCLGLLRISVCSLQPMLVTGCPAARPQVLCSVFRMPIHGQPSLRHSCLRCSWAPTAGCGCTQRSRRRWRPPWRV